MHAGTDVARESSVFKSSIFLWQRSCRDDCYSTFGYVGHRNKKHIRVYYFGRAASPGDRPFTLAYPVIDARLSLRVGAELLFAELSAPEFFIANAALSGTQTSKTNPSGSRLTIANTSRIHIATCRRPRIQVSWAYIF